MENTGLERKLEESVFKYLWKDRMGGWQSINLLLTVKAGRLLLGLNVAKNINPK